MKKRRVSITVDVEAHPIRAAADHVERLIWGRQNGREAGIGAMMDIARRHNAPMTFFLDYPEFELYGDALLDVGREVHRRGFDLEPHCHAEYTLKTLFDMDRMWAVRLNTATFEQSRRIVAYLVDKHNLITGKNPLAYRSGAYLIGRDFLDALKEGGILLDSSYNLLCEENPFSIGLRANFVWENSLREIAIPIIPYFASHGLTPWNFNAAIFLNGSIEQNLAQHGRYLKSWFKRHGDDVVAPLIMHSWSFWKLDNNGHFTIPADGALELFDALLAKLGEEYELVALGDVAAREQGVDNLPVVSPNDRSGACPVCYESVANFHDYNDGSKRQCPFCNSVERHRTLVDLVYAGAFGPDVFHYKDILHIAPGGPEKLLLRRMKRPRITTLNILPGCDLQADIQCMPEIADNSFDIVLACEVFRHVRNLDKALAEIRRVLRPGGILLCSDCLTNSDYGREITDVAEQISWYGLEKLEQYGIGDFRRFGRVDWATAFEPYFHTRVFRATDAATGSPAWWLVAVPKYQTDKDENPVLTAANLCSNAARILLDAKHDSYAELFEGADEFLAAQHGQLDNLQWLKETLFLLNFDKFTQNKSIYNQKPDFPKIIPEGMHPGFAQSFQHLLPHLVRDNGGDSTHLDIIISEAERWIDAYGFYVDSSSMDKAKHTFWMVWHDGAVARRLNTMAYAILRMAQLKKYPHALREKIMRAILDHFLVLSSDQFFSGHNNHGLIQLIGLLTFAKVFPFLSVQGSVAAICTERLNKLIPTLLTTEYMGKEHSPEYLGVLFPLLNLIANYLPKVHGGLPSIISKARKNLACFVQPCGKLAPLGDTPPYLSASIDMSQDDLLYASAALPEINNFPKSGWCIIRKKYSEGLTNFSHLAITGNYYSYTHKHCDDLSFTWSEGRQNIIVDSGHQNSKQGMVLSGPLWEKGFYYSVPNSVYVESAHAHNIVEIDNETWSRRVEAYGALPFACDELPGGYFLLRGAWHRQDKYFQQRRIIFSPRRWLLVMDDVRPEKGGAPTEHDFRQIFHFDSSLELAKVDEEGVVLNLPDSRPLHCQNFFANCQIDMRKGEIFPRLQGWQATDSTAWLNPAWSMEILHRGADASYHTLFSLIGPCRSIQIFPDSVQLDFSEACVEKIVSPELFLEMQ